VHHCGGTSVGGNMVDFYGQGGLWTNSTNCSARNIWGVCGSDAVVVDSCTNVSVSAIDVDNSAGGFAANPPASNVRLHARGAGALNGVTVSVPLSAPGESWNGKPCYLTREHAQATTGTVAAGTVVAVVDSTGMNANDLVSIVLDNGQTHYTTISIVNSPTQITLAVAVPSAATAKVVQGITTYNAGTVSWPEWNGSTFDARVGTHGGVDGI
jgi:hypothetical protein